MFIILQVYISTSDVQMHFNYHRKDNAIQREGFLRFRGAEDCHTTHCLYRGINLTCLARSHTTLICPSLNSGFLPFLLPPSSHAISP